MQQWVSSENKRLRNSRLHDLREGTFDQVVYTDWSSKLPRLGCSRLRLQQGVNSAVMYGEIDGATNFHVTFPIASLTGSYFFKVDK